MCAFINVSEIELLTERELKRMHLQILLPNLSLMGQNEQLLARLGYKADH